MTIFVIAILLSALCLPLLLIFFMHPYWGALAIVASIPIMSLLSLGGTSASMLLGIAVSLCWIANSIVTRRQVRTPLFLTAMLGFVVLVGVSLIVAGFDYNALRMLLTYLALAAMTLLLYDTVNSEGRLLQLLTALTVSLDALALGALLIYLFDPGLYSAWHGGDMSRLNLGMAGTNAGDIAALYLLALLPAQITLFRNGRFPTRIAVAASVALWMLCIVLIESRGAMVAAVGELGVYLVLAPPRGEITRRRRRLGSVVVTVVMLLVIASPLLSSKYLQRFSEKSESRTILWRIAVGVTKQHILFGVGAGHFAEALRVSPPLLIAQLLNVVVAKSALNYDSPHNLVLSILVEDGLFGLLMFLLLIFLAVRDGVRALKARPWNESNELLRELLAGIAAVLVGALFLTADRDRMLYVILATVAVAARLARISHTKIAAAAEVRPRSEQLA